MHFNNAEISISGDLEALKFKIFTIGVNKQKQSLNKVTVSRIQISKKWKLWTLIRHGVQVGPGTPLKFKSGPHDALQSLKVGP